MCCATLSKFALKSKATCDAKKHITLPIILSNNKMSVFLPIAFSRNPRLLRFFTSHLVPNGVLGLCSEILASTLKLPSDNKLEIITHQKKTNDAEVMQNSGQFQI